MGKLPLLATPLLLLAACTADKKPAYHDPDGFSITPPPGWVERARGDAMTNALAHKQNAPLPPLGGTAKAPPERLLVRYDRVASGHLGWLRVSVAEIPATTTLKQFVTTKTPGAGWKREGEVEEFELNGQPAARAAFLGRWGDQQYLCETVAVRKGDQVYVISVSVPPADSAGREQVRQAVASAAWQ